MKLSHLILLCRAWRGALSCITNVERLLPLSSISKLQKISLFHHCAVHIKCFHLLDLLQTHAEMKEIEHLMLFAPSRVHICMINDCSPQHFTLAHFTDGLADKKLCPSAVCRG